MLQSNAILSSLSASDATALRPHLKATHLQQRWTSFRDTRRSRRALVWITSTSAVVERVLQPAARSINSARRATCRCARKIDFPQRLQRDFPGPVSPHKYSCSRLPQSPLQLAPSRPGRGALAIVTNVGRDAVDAAASGARWCSRGGLRSVSEHSVQTTGDNAWQSLLAKSGGCVRQNRVVLSSSDFLRLGKTQKTSTN